MRRVKPGDSFLEIGPGNFKLSRELLKKFKNGVAIDFEDKVKNYYDVLAPEDKQRMELVIGDFTKHKFKQKFDCVVACEVMEHIDDDKKFLTEIAKLLKPGGQILISVPARQKFWTVHDEVVGHVRRYEKAATAKLFEAAGYKNVRVYSYGFPFVNFFWFLRSFHGRIQKRQKAGWSKEKQTKESGVGQLPKFLDVFGVVVNKYTFYLPNILSSVFDNYDLSEGYIIDAER